MVVVAGMACATTSTPAAAEDLRAEAASHRYDASSDSLLVGGSAWGGDLALERRLVERAPDGSNERELVRVAAEESIAGFRLASGGRRIAVLVSGGRGISRVLVTDRAGRGIVSIPNAWSFSWSPDGTKIAYTTGSYRSTVDDVPFDSTGTWVFDVSSGAHAKVLEGGRYVNWAAFDGAIYIYDIPNWYEPSDRVLRFDPVDSSAIETGHRGIEFSPSGEFYVSPSIGRGRTNVYRSENDECVSCVARAIPRLYPELVAWVPGEPHLLSFISGFDGATGERIKTRSVVYDPTTDDARDLAGDAILGRKDDEAVILRSGKVVMKELWDALR